MLLLQHPELKNYETFEKMLKNLSIVFRDDLKVAIDDLNEEFTLMCDIAEQGKT